MKILSSLLNDAVLTASVTHNFQNSRYFWCAVWKTKSWFKSKPTRKLQHANSILEYFEYFCQMSSKSTVIILSYTVSKFARFFLRHSVEYVTRIRSVESGICRIATGLLYSHTHYRASWPAMFWCFVPFVTPHLQCGTVFLSLSFLT